MGKFIGKLRVELLEDTNAGSWRRLEPQSYEDDKGVVHTAPVSQVTDFCSVPRVPVVYELLGNKFRIPGGMHDAFYDAPHTMDRLTADNLLYEMLIADGATEEEAEAIYLAVREFGGEHWA